MNNKEVIKNIVGLMASFYFEIKALPDDLKCAKCKSVLKNACQMPCDCRLCRTCVDNVMASGGQFCPGISQECGGTPLSTALLDYRANNSILKLTAKCPLMGCTYVCPLAEMESHMCTCLSKNIDCPFRELGCAHGALPNEEMSAHLLQESLSHSEILIGAVANIIRDMEMLKRKLVLKNEQGRHLENAMRLIIDENKSINNVNKSIKIDIKSVKDENKSIKDEIKLIKCENKSIKDENKSLKEKNKSINDEIKSIKEGNKSIKEKNKTIKDENKAINDVKKSIKIDIKSITEENKSIKEEMKLIKIENESIKREKEILSDRVRKLSEKLEREIDQRRQSDERDSARISEVTEAVASNRDALGTEMKPVRDDIQSISDQCDCIKHQMVLIQVAAGLGQLDDWLIEEDVNETDWDWDEPKISDKFVGWGRPYTYELEFGNSVSRGILWIRLRIWAGPSDSLLEWPFRGAVTITVGPRDRCEACSRRTLQCEIERPGDDDYEISDLFQFSHAALRGAGLDLERGVHVSCQILPSESQSPRV